MLNLKLLALKGRISGICHCISILAFFNSVRTNENDIAVLFQSFAYCKNSVKYIQIYTVECGGIDKGIAIWVDLAFIFTFFIDLT